MPPLVVAAIDPSDSAGGQLERRLVEQKLIPRLMRYGCGRRYPVHGIDAFSPTWNVQGSEKIEAQEMLIRIARKLSAERAPPDLWSSEAGRQELRDRQAYTGEIGEAAFGRLALVHIGPMR
jgi:hypothetical protein